MSLRPASSGRSASHILIVDDDLFVRDVMAMILDGLGYSVTATGDGLEALRWLDKKPYELVITDLKMPGMDGPALYKEVLRRWPTTGPRVLFTSGFSDIPSYEEAGGTLDVPVLRKPFTLDALRDALDRMLTPV
jgi:CheY-like chemotaxis protein